MNVIKVFRFLLPSIVLSSVLGCVNIVAAQTYQPSNRVPIADNTLGTQVSGNGNNFTITGGVSRGQNLFQSFQDFSVPTGGAATFINPVGNQVIITRVTGNSFLDINGTINSQGANFFLTNPTGIVFGTGAQLNVGKIFAVSTANAIDLVDGTGKTINFGTNAAGDAPLLAIDPNVSFNVSRLNFSGGTGEIKNFGTLRTTNPNQYFGLFGGDVTINGGQINAPGGRIELGGLTAPGKVEFSPGTGIPVSFPAGVTRSNVALTNQSTVNVAGAGNGDVVINARNIELSGDSLIRAGIEQGLGTPTAIAGDVRLNATGAISIYSNSAVVNNVRINAQGQGGNIIIDADTLTIRDNGSAIQAGTYGRGNTGDIRVSIAESIDLSGSYSGINTLVATNAVGNGGNITVDTGSLSMQTGAVIAAVTVGRGNAGNVNVRANTVVLSAADIASTMEGVGNGGNISIAADTVSLLQSATLTATTFGLGNAGNIQVTAKNAVTLANPNTAIFSAIDSGAIGSGGNISIEAGTISFSDGAQIRALSRGQGNAGNTSLTATDNIALTGERTAIFNTVEPGGVGRGGNIDVRAGSLSLSNGAFMTASNNGTGDSGDIKVRVRGSVDLVGTNTSDLRGGLATLVGNKTVGNSGNISVDARSVSIRAGASLLAGNLGQGNSGTITISATDAAFLSGAGGLFVTTASDRGIGGDIAIAAPQIAVDNGSRINAGSVSGNGGNIRIGSNSPTTNLLLLRHGAQIATDAAGTSQQGGNGGNISINSQFIVAIPTENSDITANAVKGSGGNVNINTQGLFGIQFRPQQTSFSDITVSSDFGQSGNIRINTPGIDPGKDLGELPQVPIDASTQISQTCNSKQIDNKLYITGRGGHPPNTEDPFLSDVVWLDTRGTQIQPVTSNARIEPSRTSLQPAVGWTFDREGKVTLVAANTSGEANLDRATCPPSQNFRSK